MQTFGVSVECRSRPSSRVSAGKRVETPCKPCATSFAVGVDGSIAAISRAA